MRTLAIATGLTLLALSALPAQAQPTGEAAPADAAAAGPPPAPPRIFQAAGYSQRDITPGLCKVVGPKETQCEIPEMTAGRYFIVAAGTGTAAGDGAVHKVEIRLDFNGAEQSCASAQSQTPKDGKPWTEGTRTISVGCAVQLVSDGKIVVRALYALEHATTDQKGPALFFRKLPWDPILTANVVPVQLTQK